MTIDRNPDHLHPAFAIKIRALAQDLGRDTPLEIFETFRSSERQHALFLQIPKVTNANAWQSAHQWGLACDFASRRDDQWSWDVPDAIIALFRRRVHEYGLYTSPSGFDPLHVQVGRDWRQPCH